MNPVRWISVSGFVCFALACGSTNPSHDGTPRTSFNDGMRKDMLDTDLQRLQFYVSSPILLTRELASEEKGVSSGHRFRIAKGRRIEEVFIDSNTPGVVVGMREQSFLVSFEPAVEGKDVALAFSLSQERQGGNYYLVGDNWTPEGGRVRYGEKDFHASTESADAYLMIDYVMIEKVREEHRTLKGRRLSDQ
jgi:hypothetical protein